MKFEFEDGDLDSTMATMAAEPYVYNVPTMIGGTGRGAVRDFYRTHLIGKMPEDTKIVRVSRTVGREQLADELILSFTHDREIDFMLPGIAPTGKRVVLPHVVVVKFEGDKIAHEHIYWDQGSLLAQIGILDPTRVPVGLHEPAAKLLDLASPSRRTNRRRT